MYLLLEARVLAPDVKLFRVEAPRIALKRKPGQFIILRIDEHGERIPLLRRPDYVCKYERPPRRQ